MADKSAKTVTTKQAFLNHAVLDSEICEDIKRGHPWV
jgi:hypothetical protein